MGPSRSLLCFSLLVTLLTAAQSHAQQCACRPACATGTIFVADGSGDLDGTPTRLEAVIGETCLPMSVQRVAWSRGRHRLVTDLIDHENHVQHGEHLAACVLAYRRSFPGHRVCLIGHSAGAAVVLAAAERLPVGSVDRIVLLAPAVAACYDLRAALRCSREGIDSFHSWRDQTLGVLIWFSGTADRRWGAPAAGWLGFDAPEWDCCEFQATGGLRQYGWHPGLWKTGYVGGHYGCRSADHLRETVLPLLCGPSAPPPMAPALMPVPAPESAASPAEPALAAASPAEPALAPATKPSLSLPPATTPAEEPPPAAPLPEVSLPPLALPGRTSEASGPAASLAVPRSTCQVQGFAHDRPR